MKKIFRKIAMMVMVGCAPIMTSCDALIGESDNPAPNPPVVHIQGITIKGFVADEGTTASTTVTVGTKVQLSVAISPADTKEVEVVWQSGDESIVKVSDSGLITAVAAGEVVVKVSSKVDPSVSATLTIKVVEEESGDDDEVDGSIDINPEAVDQSTADARAL